MTTTFLGGDVKVPNNILDNLFKKDNFCQDIYTLHFTQYMAQEPLGVEGCCVVL